MTFDSSAYSSPHPKTLSTTTPSTVCNVVGYEGSSHSPISSNSVIELNSATQVLVSWSLWLNCIWIPGCSRHATYRFLLPRLKPTASASVLLPPTYLSYELPQYIVNGEGKLTYRIARSASW